MYKMTSQSLNQREAVLMLKYFKHCPYVNSTCPCGRNVLYKKYCSHYYSSRATLFLPYCYIYGRHRKTNSISFARAIMSIVPIALHPVLYTYNTAPKKEHQCRSAIE